MHNSKGGMVPPSAKKNMPQWYAIMAKKKKYTKGSSHHMLLSRPRIVGNEGHGNVFLRMSQYHQP